MDTVKRTNEEANDILLNLHKIDVTVDNNLSYAVLKIKTPLNKKLDKVNQKWIKRVEEINREFCYTNDKDIIEYDNGNGEVRHFKFNKENAKKKEEKILEEFEKLNQEMIDVPIYIYKGKLEVPFDIKMDLNGILFEIDEKKYQEQENKDE